MNAAGEMDAVRVLEFGAPEDLAVARAPVPAPGPGELLIEVCAVAANFVDILVVTGKYQFLPPRPFSPGKLPAGVVRAVGEGVTAFAPGDRVLTSAEKGGYAQFAVAEAAGCHRLPDAMSFAEAAAVALCFDTAWFALKERGRLAPGERVLVLGASGAVGAAAVQLARAFGARPIAAVSSEARAAAAREAGAEGIVDLSAPNIRDALREQVHAITGGVGVDVVIDTLGDRFTEAALRALAWRGRLVTIGFAAGDIPSVRINYLLVKNIEISGLQVSDYRIRTPDLAHACFAEIFALYDAGQVRAPAFEVLPLQAAGEALARVRDRGARARLILAPAGVAAATGSA